MEWLEREKTVIDLLKEKKPYSEIEQQLHISSRDISRIKKKYEDEEQKSVINPGEDDEQNKITPNEQSYPNVHKNKKCGPNSGPIYKDKDGQNNIPEERFNLKEENQALKDKNEELTKITLELGEENQALKHKKIELEYKLKNKYIESVSGIIALQTKSLYDDAYRLLDQDVEYCYLVYRNNRYERLVDAAQYEADRAKARWDEEQKQQIDNKFEAQDDGSIC